MASPRTSGLSRPDAAPGMGSLWFSPELTWPLPRAGPSGGQEDQELLPCPPGCGPAPPLSPEAKPSFQAPPPPPQTTLSLPQRAQPQCKSGASLWELQGLPLWGTAQQGAASFPGDCTAGEEEGQESSVILFPWLPTWCSTCRVADCGHAPCRPEAESCVLRWQLRDPS